MKTTTTPWQVGLLLNTPTTIKWSEKARRKADDQERSMVFSNFSTVDIGKSRECVAICQGENRHANAKLITRAVNTHDELVRRVERRANELQGELDNDFQGELSAYNRTAMTMELECLRELLTRAKGQP